MSDRSANAPRAIARMTPAAVPVSDPSWAKGADFDPAHNATFDLARANPFGGPSFETEGHDQEAEFADVVDGHGHVWCKRVMPPGGDTPSVEKSRRVTVEMIVAARQAMKGRADAIEADMIDQIVDGHLAAHYSPRALRELVRVWRYGFPTLGKIMQLEQEEHSLRALLAAAGTEPQS